MWALVGERSVRGMNVMRELTLASDPVFVQQRGEMDYRVDHASGWRSKSNVLALRISKGIGPVWGVVDLLDHRREGRPARFARGHIGGNAAGGGSGG